MMNSSEDLPIKFGVHASANPAILRPEANRPIPVQFPLKKRRYEPSDTDFNVPPPLKRQVASWWKYPSERDLTEAFMRGEEVNVAAHTPASGSPLYEQFYGIKDVPAHKILRDHNGYPISMGSIFRPCSGSIKRTGQLNLYSAPATAKLEQFQGSSQCDQAADLSRDSPCIFLDAIDTKEDLEQELEAACGRAYGLPTTPAITPSPILTSPYGTLKCPRQEHNPPTFLPPSLIKNRYTPIRKWKMTRAPASEKDLFRASWQPRSQPVPMLDGPVKTGGNGHQQSVARRSKEMLPHPPKAEMVMVDKNVQVQTLPTEENVKTVSTIVPDSLVQEQDGDDFLSEDRKLSPKKCFSVASELIHELKDLPKGIRFQGALHANHLDSPPTSNQIGERFKVHDCTNSETPLGHAQQTFTFPVQNPSNNSDGDHSIPMTIDTSRGGDQYLSESMLTEDLSALEDPASFQYPDKLCPSPEKAMYPEVKREAVSKEEGMKLLGMTWDEVSTSKIPSDQRMGLNDYAGKHPQKTATKEIPTTRPRTLLKSPEELVFGPSTPQPLTLNSSPPPTFASKPSSASLLDDEVFAPQRRRRSPVKKKGMPPKRKLLTSLAGNGSHWMMFQGLSGSKRRDSIVKQSKTPYKARNGENNGLAFSSAPAP